MRHWNESSPAASFISAESSWYCPRAVQECRQHCSIQSPITFLRNRVVPLTPPSLVKFRRRASGVISGEHYSVPNKDQVPELRNAVPSRAEIAVTAEPVSCVAGAMTGVPDRAECREMLGCKVPMIVPGSTMPPNKWPGSSRRAINSLDQVRVIGFTSWVVVALVNYRPRCRSASNGNRSGIVTSRSAVLSSLGVSRIAAQSW